MNQNDQFNVCRGCLQPESVTELRSLFDLRGRNAEIFQIFSGLDLSVDIGKRHIVMCDECLKEMRRAFEVQEKLFDAEESYFKVKRQEESELDAIEEEDKTTETRGKSLDQQSDFSFPSIITISDDESLAKFEPFKDVFDSSRIELLKDQEAREVLLPSKAIIAVEFMHKQNDMQNPVLNDSKKLGVTRFNITEEEVTKKKFPECMTCGKAFLSNRSLKAHVASHSPPSFQLTANNEDIEQKLLANSTNHSECATCKKTFANKSNLKRHIDLAHVKTRPFSCEICQQKFYHKTHLQIHMNIHSKNSRNNQMVEFDFKDCSKISRTKTELKHRQVAHSNLRLFVCFCGETFEMKHDLQKHQCSQGCL